MNILKQTGGFGRKHRLKKLKFKFYSSDRLHLGHGSCCRKRIITEDPVVDHQCFLAGLGIRLNLYYLHKLCRPAVSTGRAERLANRHLQPLGHLSAGIPIEDTAIISEPAGPPVAE